jgi:molecular chaperone HscA
MDRDIQVQIVRALVERLRADAALPQPRCTSIVSAIDLYAIESLLGGQETPTKTSPIDTPVQTTEDVPETCPIEQQMPVSANPLVVNTSCLTAQYDPKYVVCVDFGTARSKAFAAEIALDGEYPDEMARFELGLGKQDGDREVYSVASSVWISDDGLMFAGSEAMRRSMESHDRTRLDSIKQQLSQTSSRVDIDRSLPPDINPTQIKLTYADAICFYLAFLTDLVGRELCELKPKSLSRYTRRRFTILAWKDDQRQWAHSELKKLITRAQILADTFGSRWSDGIPVSEVKDAILQATQFDSELSRLLDPSMEESALGISEPMAAGAGRIRIDSSIKNLILVVDVGAGTTDIGLFLVNFATKTAIPVEPKSGALKRAGDHIDDLLVGHIISKVEGHPGVGPLAETNS